MIKIDRNMDEENFSGQRFEDMEMTEKWVTACDFTNTVVINADIYRSVLCSSDFSNAEIIGSSFCKKVNCDYTVFENVLFSHSLFDENTNFTGCIFKNVEFDSTTISGIFNGATFSDITFTDVNFIDNTWIQPKINIGTPDAPEYLCNEDIRQWIINGGAK